MYKKQLIAGKFEFQEDRETREKEKLTIIIEKIVAKAELLCSIQLPAVAFRAGIVDAADNEDANAMTRKASLMRMTSSEAEEVFDLKNRVLPMAERKKLFENASSTSVLACLQTSIEKHHIIDHLAIICQKAIRRIAGFQIMLKLMEEVSSNENM